MKLAPSRSRCLLVGLCVFSWAWVGLGAEEPGGEIFDNPRLVKMLKARISLAVIKKKIASSNCKFSSDSDQLIEISNAAAEGNMGKPEVDELLQIVIEKAASEKVRLKDLVDRFMNIAVNADEQEYESMVRDLLREGRGIVPELLKHMEEENELKRKGVLDVLGRVGEKSAQVYNSVRLMLSDRHPAVRAQAAKAVAALAGPGTADELIQNLDRRLSDYTDGYAMALGYLGDPKAVRTLTAVLQRSADKDARLASAFSLGLLQPTEKAAVEALLAAVLDAQDPLPRVAAAKALGKTGEPRAVEHIIRATQRFQDGRADLVRELKSFKSLQAAEFLVGCIEEDNPEVRRAANDTLKILTGATAETADEWRAVLNVIRDRPDWIPAKKEAEPPTK